MLCGRAIAKNARKCVHCDEFVRRDYLGLRGKTIWDILSLVLVPLILSGLALLIPRAQAQRQENAAALTAYLNEMTNIILTEENLEDDSVRTSIRARTVFALQELDKTHTDMVMRFVRDAGVLDWVFINAKLAGVDLSRNQLVGANLSGALASMVSGLLTWLVLLKLTPDLPSDLLAVPVAIFFLIAVSLATRASDPPKSLADASGTPLGPGHRLGLVWNAEKRF